MPNQGVYRRTNPLYKIFKTSPRGPMSVVKNRTTILSSDVKRISFIMR